MTRESHHVVPAPNGGWNVKKGGAERASKHFEKKEDAVKYGRQISKNQETELVIHKQDGRIQNADSHSNDPNPPKDRK
jgi:hypothetical protein